MSLEIRLPEKEQKKRVRIKPAGWLAIAVVSIFLLSLIGLGARELYWAARGLEALPTLPPPPTRAPTPSPVPPTPTPEGWRWAQDPVSKKRYLVPPPEEEAQIREAFNLLLALNVVENQPDEKLRHYDLDALIEKLPQYAAPPIAEMFKQKRGLEIREMAPPSPVRCTDYETCFVGQVALAIKGAIIDRGDRTEVVRSGYKSLAPHGMTYFVKVQWDREGQRWVITYWEAKPLPEAPSSRP